MTNPKGHWYRRALVSGVSAVACLGGVAASSLPSGMAGSSLASPVADAFARAHFRNLGGDGEGWADRNGMVVYADTDLLGMQQTSNGAGLANSHDPARPNSYPYDQTFKLHSVPGAKKVAYLDFEGFTVANSAWNASFSGGAPFTVEPYDSDGNPGSFGPTELNAVQEIWQRVAEKFAPFQIDVTTEAPADTAIDRTGTADDQFGTRIVITNTNTVYQSCGCGGISYVGAFNYVNTGDPSRSHAYYQPSFVFVNGVGTSPKTVAEAATHELGHSLGLSHQGNASMGAYTGQGAWAPIMGTGYSKPITQWSKGEFATANNHEDELAVMQSHGAALVGDEAGDDPAHAMTLSGSADGIISTPTDVDVYSFSTPGGPATITATPSPIDPALDLGLDLLDGAGNVLASADPPSAFVSADAASGLSATLRQTLAAGTYYVRLRGVGSGDPNVDGYTNYGSLGHYHVSVATGSAANSAPQAAAAASVSSGRAPLGVTFSSVGSADPDGSIVGYHWDFGDGNAADEPNPSHTYGGPGSFTATLTVTDDQGATATSSVVITGTNTGNRVDSLELSMQHRSKTKSYAHATVAMTAPSGAPLGRALVLGAWSGSDRRWVLGITDANGVVEFDSVNATAKKANYGFTVLWAGYLQSPGDWSADAVTTANVWNGGPQYWASSSPT